MITGIGLTLLVLAILGLVAFGLALLGANDTAAERQNLDEQLEQLRTYAAQRRRDQQREREACVADLRRPPLPGPPEVSK